MELFSSWTGSGFLLFYSTLLGLCSLVAWWMSAHLRSGGRRGASVDAESLALLAGGRERFVDALVADLIVRGGLAPGEAGTLSVVDPRLPTTPAGRTLLAADAPFSLRQARAMLEIHAERLAARLQRGGLLLRPAEMARLRWISVAPFAAVFLIGFYRERAASSLGEPTGFLIALMALTAVLALLRFFTIDPRTQAGIAELACQKAAAQCLARAPRPDEVSMAVALFGTEVLVGTPWEPVHALRQQGGTSNGSGGDSSDGGSSSSDSGCGGGGCGGCGS